MRIKYIDCVNGEHRISFRFNNGVVTEVVAWLNEKEYEEFLSSIDVIIGRESALILNGILKNSEREREIRQGGTEENLKRKERERAISRGEFETKQNSPVQGRRLQFETT